MSETAAYPVPDIAERAVPPAPPVIQIISYRYKWKKEAVQGMKEAVTGPSKEVIALKQANARLKKLVAEEALLIDRLRELNETLSRGKNDGRRLSQ